MASAINLISSNACSTNVSKRNEVKKSQKQHSSTLIHVVHLADKKPNLDGIEQKKKSHEKEGTNKNRTRPFYNDIFKIDTGTRIKKREREIEKKPQLIHKNNRNKISIRHT